VISYGCGAAACVHERPRHQHLGAIRGDDRRVQVHGRIEVVELRGLDERVQCGGDFGAAVRLRAVVILAADDRAANRTFGAVVVDSSRAS
jgi:hypothetical protein